ncbi:MAG TPA: serine/threonine-protein kinase [Vicinamibacterales bacterium]|jgi:serine/threonine protein kinase|nr:serine/threonine-protein kinase [Vicinamibacterales bacterium]
MIGRSIGKYRILERIGRGGMGTVYRAIDETLQREVAIKVLNVTEEEALKRFRTEAITLARLQHPAIAMLFELTEDDGDLLMVMEFVRGETLQKLAERMGKVPPDFAAQLCSQALDGLWHAHRAGIVHRDLKPGNLMVTGDGLVKVMDFGIARIAGSEHLTSDGFTMGTPAYMAPEQVRGEEVDARSDIYAMGVVLYRLWTGQLPFLGESPFAIAHRQLNDAPMPLKTVAPELPSWCELVLSRAMAKNPLERYQTALEFKNALATAASFMSLDDVATVTMRTPRAVMLPPASRPVVTTDSARLASSGTPVQTLQTGLVPPPTSGPTTVVAPPPDPTSQVTAAPATGRTVVISPRQVFSGVAALMVVLVVLAIGTVLAIKRMQHPAVLPSEPVALSPAPAVNPPAPQPVPAAPAAQPEAPVAPPPSVAAADPAAPPAKTPASTAKPPSGLSTGSSKATATATGAAGTANLPPAPSRPIAAASPVPETTPAVTFDKVKLLVVEGEKAREDDAVLRFASGAVQILGPSNRVIGSLPYESVRTVTTTRSKQPRWRGPDGSIVDAKMSSGAFGFLKSDRNWIGLVTPTAAYVFRVDDDDLQKLTETVTKRTGATLVRLSGK